MKSDPLILVNSMAHFMSVFAQAGTVRSAFFKIYFTITILLFRQNYRFTVANKRAGATEILYTLTYVIFRVS
jgi:hypothetical protein